MVVDEGGDGVARRGWGHGSGQPPPPPASSLPNQSSPSSRLLKAPGPSFAATRKAAVAPRLAQALQKGCARAQPLFAGASYAHMTVERVFCRLARSQIRRHSKSKGTWWTDSKRGGACTWCPLPGETLSPVPEGINVRSPSLLYLCGDPRGVWFRTAHFHVVLRH